MWHVKVRPVDGSLEEYGVYARESEARTEVMRWLDANYPGVWWQADARQYAIKGDTRLAATVENILTDEEKRKDRIDYLKRYIEDVEKKLGGARQELAELEG